MARSIIEALEYMVQLVQIGWVFLDAARKTATAFKVDQKTLEEAYNNRP